MDKIKQYQELYIRYKELLKKTSIKAYNVTSGGKVTVQDISPADIEERNEVVKKLLNGLGFLSDNQLIDLAGDEGLAQQALEILTKRKEVQ